MDPVTGEVRAMVGGRDFKASSFNRVTQAKRQAGSAFKPFVYAAALEHGFSPGTLLTDLDNPVWTPQGNWVPEDGHSSESSMTMRAALKTSSNRAAVRMLQQVGIPAAVNYRRSSWRRTGSRRSVAGARVRRGHADVDGVGVRGVCQQVGLVPDADSDYAR